MSEKDRKPSLPLAREADEIIGPSKSKSPNEKIEKKSISSDDSAAEYLATPEETSDELLAQESDANSSASLPARIGGRAKSSSTDLVRYDPLQRYLAELRNLPALSREEEHQLAVRYQEGDVQAGYRLVMANLRLVVVIAREYQRNVQNVLDLVQEGNIGLLEAVKKFDPFRGIRFPSYAVYWVRAYMLRYLINNVRLVKIGTTQAQRKLFFNLVKEKEQLEREGYVPEAKLLAERLNVKESEVLEMQQRMALPDISVDAPSTPGSEGLDLHGVLPDESDTAEESLVKSQFDSAVRDAIEEYCAQADQKELALIRQRLFTDDPVTLQVIADQFSVSRERVRQIEERLKRRLKEHLAKTLQLDSQGEVVLDTADEDIADRDVSDGDISKHG